MAMVMAMGMAMAMAMVVGMGDVDGHECRDEYVSDGDGDDILFFSDSAKSWNRMCRNRQGLRRSWPT